MNIGGKCYEEEVERDSKIKGRKITFAEQTYFNLRFIIL